MSSARRSGIPVLSSRKSSVPSRPAAASATRQSQYQSVQSVHWSASTAVPSHQSQQPSLSRAPSVASLRPSRSVSVSDVSNLQNLLQPPKPSLCSTSLRPAQGTGPPSLGAATPTRDRGLSRLTGPTGLNGQGGGPGPGSSRLTSAFALSTPNLTRFSSTSFFTASKMKMGAGGGPTGTGRGQLRRPQKFQGSDPRPFRKQSDFSSRETQLVQETVNAVSTTTVTTMATIGTTATGAQSAEPQWNARSAPSNKEFLALFERLTTFLNGGGLFAQFSHQFTLYSQVNQVSQFNQVTQCSQFRQVKDCREKQQKQKPEESVPRALRLLLYPFPVKKSDLFNIGAPHSWPTLLAALAFLSHLCRVPAPPLPLPFIPLSAFSSLRNLLC